MRRIYSITGFFTPVVAGVILARLFPDQAVRLAAAVLVGWPIWGILRSLHRMKPVRPDMAQVFGQLFVVVFTVGFVYFLIRGGGSGRYLIAGCYFAALAGTWVYRLAYRQGVTDGIASSTENYVAARRAAEARSAERKLRADHLRQYHRPRPGPRRVIDVEPREDQP